MNWAPPDYVKQANKDALDDVAANHYSLPRGRINLRNALSDALSAQFKLEDGRALDPATEIAVTAGANEGPSQPSPHTVGRLSSDSSVPILC